MNNKLPLQCCALILIMLLTMISPIGCSSSQNAAKLHIVEWIDDGSFISHSAITLQAQDGARYVVVTSKSDQSKETVRKGDWIDLKVGLSVKLQLIERDSLPILILDPLYGLMSPWITYPGLTMDHFDSTGMIIDEDTVSNRITLYKDRTIQCPLYQSDDIVGTYVRKSAVVNK